MDQDMDPEASYDICPFDKSHKILKSRMSTHLTRCKQNHPKFKQCEYNSNHYSLNMEQHYTMCPERKKSSEIKLIIPQASTTNKETCSIISADLWEDEQPTYNARQALPSKCVIRVDNKLLPKAKRRAFQEDEKTRLQLFVNYIRSV